MVSDRERVTLTGRLEGMGRNVSCTVSVTKVIAPSNMGFRYGKREIIEYPLDLPFGDYWLTFDGERTPLRLGENGWKPPY